jgi:hypothetical protein
MQLSCILFVKQIFNECGFSNIWETELFDNVDYLNCVIKQRLEDQFLQNWDSLVQNSPKSINYKTFKTEFKYEEYLKFLEIKYAILLCHNIHLRFSLGMFCHRPVSMGSLLFVVLNLQNKVASFISKIFKYSSYLSSVLKVL